MLKKAGRIPEPILGKVSVAVNSKIICCLSLCILIQFVFFDAIVCN